MLYPNPPCVNQPLAVVQAHTDIGEEGDGVDTDSDYEEEPTTGCMKAQTDGSVKDDGIPSHKLLPGAFTT